MGVQQHGLNTSTPSLARQTYAPVRCLITVFSTVYSGAPGGAATTFRDRGPTVRPPLPLAAGIGPLAASTAQGPWAAGVDALPRCAAAAKAEEEEEEEAAAAGDVDDCGALLRLHGSFEAAADPLP